MRATAVVGTLALVAVCGVFLLGLISASRARAFDLSVYSTLFAEYGAVTEIGLPYGPHGRNTLDIYRPAVGGQTGPIVLFLYGGGWRMGDRGIYGFVGSALAARGITTVIPDYRLYPEVRFPAFVDDAALAYRWVAANVAAGPGGARRPIVLVGHSAGAHSAALIALDRRYLTTAGGEVARPAGLVGLAGPYAFDPTTYAATAKIFSTAVKAGDTRPVTFAGRHAPRTLLMHGLEDDTVKLWNTRQLAGALSAQGADVRTLELAGVGHIGIVLAISTPFRWRAPVLDEIVAFIEAVGRQRR